MDRRTFLAASTALPIAGIAHSQQTDPHAMWHSQSREARERWHFAAQGRDHEWDKEAADAAWAEMDALAERIAHTQASTPEGVLSQVRFAQDLAGDGACILEGAPPLLPNIQKALEGLAP